MLIFTVFWHLAGELITAEMISTFRASDVVKAIWNRARRYPQLTDKKPVTKRVYRDVVNLLAIELSIDNAQRTGALVNMTVVEYRAMDAQGVVLVGLVRDLPPEQFMAGS